MDRFFVPNTFEGVIFWFTAYYATECGLRRLLRSKNPLFYQKLLSTRKDLPYFGIAMGFLITLFSAPTCGYAAYTAVYPWNVQPELADSISGMASTSGMICMVSRGVLWVSELNRLGEHMFYRYHHLGSLASLISLLAIRIPLGAVYGIYAGLLSELSSDLVWLAGAHGCNAENTHWFRRLEAANVVLYAVTRAPGSVFGVYFVLNAGLDATGQIVCAFSLAVYTAFITYNVLKWSSKLGWFHVVSEHPAHVRVGCHIFTAYGVFMGLGLGSLASGAVILYADVDESSKVAAVVCRILLCAVFGARLLSLIFEDGLAKLVSDPVAAILRPGFWLHGGILGAGISIFLSRDSILRPLDMMAALGIALPLFEAFSRIGCYSYGCCFGRTLSPSEITGSSRPLLWRVFPVQATTYTGRTAAAVRLRPELCSKPLFPIQLISAALFMVQFFCIIALLLAGGVTIAYAGWTSLVLHAFARVITEKFRDDFRGDIGGSSPITVTGILAGVQILVGAFGIAAIRAKQISFNEEGLSHVVSWDRVCCAFTDTNVLCCASFAFVLGFVVYGYNFRKIGAWVDRK